MSTTIDQALIRESILPRLTKRQRDNLAVHGIAQVICDMQAGKPTSLTLDDILARIARC